MAKKKNVEELVTGRIPLMLLRSLTAIYVFLMMVVYPIYFENKYYNMGDAKWHFFRNVTFVGVPILLALFVWYLIELGLKTELVAGIKTFFKNISITDGFVLAFLVISLISYIASPYREFALWGYEGWYMGIIAQISFVLVYLFVSRFWRWDPPFVGCYFAAAAFVFLMGVLMRFNIDPMVMYEDIEDYYKTLFISTLGQTSWYSSYMILIVPLGLFGFWYYDKRYLRILFGIFSSLSFMTLVTQNSDSAYLGLVGIFVMLAWFSFDTTKRFMRFLECIMICAGSFAFIGLCQKAFTDRVVKIDDLSITASQSSATWIILIAVAVIYILLLFIGKKKEIDLSKISKIKYVLAGLFVLAIVGGTVYIYLNTNYMLPDSLMSDNNYLFFNDNWGNNRGSSWRIAIQSFGMSDLPVKIFGAGPDCFSYDVYTYCGAELYGIWGETTTLACAHNEWLNMLITEGIIGVIAYVGIFFATIYRCVKNSSKCPELIGIAMATAAYITHNFFCYQQIICTPIIFILMGIGEEMIRRGYTREQGLL